MYTHQSANAGVIGPPVEFLPLMETLEERLLLALLDPMTQPRFVNLLPVPAVMQPTVPGGSDYEVSMTQFQQDLGLVDPITQAPLLTTVWGYNGSYPGATFEVRTDEIVNVLWTNDLVDSSAPLPHLLPVDTSLHWAAPAGWPASGVPTVAHLHGGHTESASDGLPEQWFTPDFDQVGIDWVKETYVYDNSQEAATLWYHDHALGITRLNVYAGLAGYYLIRDDWEDGLGLPSGDYEIPILIQDRMFNDTGELFFPSTPVVPGAPDPSVLPEFFGDTIIVNGKAWPTLEVEPRKYRLRFLNGSDSRVYSLSLNAGPRLYQIGTDDGLLYEPVALNELVIAPGERADVVIDFSHPSLAGRTIIMKNSGREPFPKGATVNPKTAGQIMAFKVTKPLAGPDTSVLPATLRQTPIQPLINPVTTRQLVLFEGTDEFGRLQPLLGTVAGGGMHWAAPITENPGLDDVEVWEIYNTTPDTHPIHLHLVAFQILGRQKFKATVDPLTGVVTNIKLIGKEKPPAANEAGWKDTVQMNPGEATRIIANFDREGLYVWHCHILSHEDHEMMRPLYVGTMPMAAAQSGSAVQETNAALGDLLGGSEGGSSLVSFAAEGSGSQPASLAVVSGYALPAVGAPVATPEAATAPQDGPAPLPMTLLDGSYNLEEPLGGVDVLDILADLRPRL